MSKKRIKYKNVAIFAVAVLLVIFFITAACTKDDDEKKPIVTTTEPEQSVNNPLKDMSFQKVTVNSADVSRGTLVLVNNDHSYLTEIPEEEMVIVATKKLSIYSVKDWTVYLQDIVMTPLNDMIKAFNDETGISNIIILSGYRTKEYQQGLYEDELASTGQETSRLVARPGYSEHHTGYAVDFGLYPNEGTTKFTGEGDYAWFSTFCYKYGFILRYREDKSDLTYIDYEPWHFRYVGKIHSNEMHKKDFCLEEYVDFLRDYTLEKGAYPIMDTQTGVNYGVYFVPMTEGVTEIPIPVKENGEMYEYEISGNNVDGFLVTVKLG